MNDSTLCPMTYCHRTIAARNENGCDHCKHPPARGPVAHGWFAALADARFAASKAENEWLVSKLDEIHQHLRLVEAM